MVLALYMGHAQDIEARLLGVPNSFATTVQSYQGQELTLADASGFSLGSVVSVARQRQEIAAKDGNTITVKNPFFEAPVIGEKVTFFNADYSKYRDSKNNPIVFIDDLSTGGETGNGFNRDLILNDWDGLMPRPENGFRLTIFDDQDPDNPLFSGVVELVNDEMITRVEGRFHLTYRVFARGFLSEADSLGIDERPVFNINSGKFLEYLTKRYTSLDIGEIDTTDSPTLAHVRLAPGRRFSQVLRQLGNLWPEAEAYIENGHTNGRVILRKRVEKAAPFTLNDAYRTERGRNNVTVERDFSKTYNIVKMPFYQLQRREPDYFVQDTVTDNAFLKTSVTLDGIPAEIEESVLVFDDFNGLSQTWLEFDKDNPSPPSGYNESAGYLITGEINQVLGLNLLQPPVSTKWGEIGLITNPAETQPITGEERQLIFAQEFVINQLGDAYVNCIVDQTTRRALVETATLTKAILDDVSAFVVGDRIKVAGEESFITAITGNEISVNPAFAVVPAVGEPVEVHELATSRIKRGLRLDASGDLRLVIDGQESSIGQAYTAETHSFRYWFEAYETTIDGFATLESVTLADATNFESGDVVEVFSRGSRKAPEVRTITKSGSTITFDTDLKNLPSSGYRVRTRGKLNMQVKGGNFSGITSRDWVTIYNEANTWETEFPNAKDEPLGVAPVINKSLVGTLTLFQVKKPPSVTAKVGNRYLHIGTQEIDSAEADVDCLIRKVGEHYQLDFFPDTKQLWGSGERLELIYDEKFYYELERSDAESMRSVAQARGFSTPPGTRPDELKRLGGRQLESLEPSPYPIELSEASNTLRGILDALKNLAVKVIIQTNSYADSIAQAGQLLKTTLPEAPKLEVQRVEVVELPGAKLDNGRSLYRMTIIAGSLDRVGEILTRRVQKANTRLVLDDGVFDDSITKIIQYGFSETVRFTDLFETLSCNAPTRVISGTRMGCLLIN